MARRLLALDGGGIRGMITLQILAEVESQLRAAKGAGEEFRLGRYFDYIGGTSTGAIIAAGLSRGMSVKELIAFYRNAGALMFEPAALFRRLRNLYKSEPLEEMLKQVLGERTTMADLAHCLLLVVLRNATTDSPWPLSSNPKARYNDVTRPDCNTKIPLWKIIRASTAAPIYFPPEVVEWEVGNPDKSFVFVDGGITPYNNPAFLLFRMATMPEYRLEWPSGEREMMVVSVGTGAAPDVGGDILSPHKNVVSNLSGLPGALMYGAQIDQDINCRMIGRCVHGAVIDREIGDMIPRRDGQPVPLSEDLGRRFLYARYQADLSSEGLAALNLADVKPANVQKMDSVEFIDDLTRVGQAAARQVRMSDFQGLV